MNKMVEFLARKAPQVFRRSRYSGVRIVDRVSDIPKKTDSSIFLVERDGRYQWAVFDCPCRTGHRLTVSLRKTEQPHWAANCQGSKVSLYPSLWLGDNCRSHFWIRDNKVNWV